MKLTEKMQRHYDSAVRHPYRTVNNALLANPSGLFMYDGNSVARSVIAKSSSYAFEKQLYCGTCGTLLSLHEAAVCVACHHERLSVEPTSMRYLLEEWRVGRVAIQSNKNDHLVKKVVRKNCTDDTSTVTSAQTSATSLERQLREEALAKRKKELSLQKISLKYAHFLNLGHGRRAKTPVHEDDERRGERVLKENSRLLHRTKATELLQKAIDGSVAPRIQTGVVNGTFLDSKVDRAVSPTRLRRFGKGQDDAAYISSDKNRRIKL